MTSSGVRKTTIGDIIIVIAMIILIILCIMPIINLLAVSFSEPAAIMRRDVTFWPIGFNTEAFVSVLTDARFMRSMVWTIGLTATVVVTNLTMTILLAYPLTFMSLKGRKIISFFVIFTMLFGAGLIPTFILFRDLGLLNNPLVLIIPGFISVFNMILMRNFFLGIPESLKESAEMDGAGPMKVLVSIYLPLSLPSIATIGLFYAVGRWNGFQDALFFMTDASEWHPIQMLLYNIIQNIVGFDTGDPGGTTPPGWGPAVQAAAIFIAMAPILCAYPFAQKYFVQGATLGAVKG